ncbi:hypothetical protein DST30_22845 [Salmonella enterica subsp. enterica serovar Panama]|nr:hypothetical protein [Salmonella enterica subsp. enterica serovar Panama]EIP0347654.1 hypothetical protein [Shigella sonnei]
MTREAKFLPLALNGAQQQTCLVAACPRQSVPGMYICRINPNTAHETVVQIPVAALPEGSHKPIIQGLPLEALYAVLNNEIETLMEISNETDKTRLGLAKELLRSSLIHYTGYRQDGCDETSEDDIDA